MYTSPDAGKGDVPYTPAVSALPGLHGEKIQWVTLPHLTVHCETLANPWRYPRIAGAAEQNCGEI